MELIRHSVRAFADWFPLEAQHVLDVVRAIIDQVVQWRALPYVIIAFVLLAVYLRYLSWKAGWLSGEIDKEIRRMQRRRFRSTIEAVKRITARSIYRRCRAGVYHSIDAIDRYVRQDAWSGIGAFYFPSFTSFFVACVFLLAFFIVPHMHGILSVKPLVLLRGLSDELTDEESVRKVFEGLIVVAVALIVFVAEFDPRYKECRTKAGSSTH